LGTPTNDVCALTPDQTGAGFAGFYVSVEPEAGPCPFVTELGWEYAPVTMDESTGLPKTIVGPYGNDWKFMEVEQFSTDYQDWFVEFVTSL
jgi:hypothetical protein